MLVTFHSRAYADIVMFGDVAQTLLKMMGHSGTVPGALLAADVPAALARLEAALAARPETPQPVDWPEDEEPAPPIAVRALPLRKLLAASARAGCDVMWD